MFCSVISLDLCLPYRRSPLHVQNVQMDKASVCGVASWNDKIYVVRSNCDKVSVFHKREPRCVLQEIAVKGTLLFYAFWIHSDDNKFTVR
jgi:hypothetical protein